MSQTIAFVNGKGGTGKTTLALLVAWVLNFRGQNVCIDDRDPQGNATAAATAYGIPILTSAPGNNPAHPSASAPDFVMIDTSPDIERPTTLEAIRHADLVVIVTRPEFFDMASTLATAKVIQRERLPEGKTCVVFNQVRPQTIVAKEMLEASGRIPFPTLKTRIHQRAVYSKANRFGWESLSLIERQEVLELCIELLSQ